MASADEARGIRGHVADTSEDDASLEEMTGKKRRLSSAQVRSLEENFELEKKVEPQRKVQLARDLGLHPRQVAVWFQNRRARYKTKQLQKDYDLLRFDHETLSAEFRVLKHENEKLLAQLERLKQSLRAEDENAADVRGIIATSSPSQTGPPAVAKGRMLGPLNRLLLLTDNNAPLTPLSLSSSCNRAAPVGPALGCLTSDTESSGTLNDWNEESPHSVKYPASHVTNANGEDKFLSAPNFYHQIFSEEACNSLWDWTP